MTRSFRKLKKWTSPIFVREDGRFVAEDPLGDGHLFEKWPNEDQPKTGDILQFIWNCRERKLSRAPQITQ